MLKDFIEMKKIIENLKDAISVRAIESICDIPEGTIPQWINGTRELPEKHLGKLEEFFRDIQHTIERELKYSKIESVDLDTGEVLISEVEDLDKIPGGYDRIDKHIYYNEKKKDFLFVKYKNKAWTVKLCPNLITAKEVRRKYES